MHDILVTEWQNEFYKTAVAAIQIACFNDVQHLFKQLLEKETMEERSTRRARTSDSCCAVPRDVVSYESV